jgi:peptidoglycan/LPS O-acetylase OafA/YrhL
LFFIMSAVALTHWFSARPFAFLPTVARRTIRLGLPMAAATLLAAVLYSPLPDAHVVAAGSTGSPWLRDVGPGEISVASTAHQIAFEGLLTGFSDSSLLPVRIKNIPKLAYSARGLDTPLWTLHIEFCGSLLVMLLVAVRASISQAAYRATCAILGCAFVLSPMSLFIIGHLAASHPRRVDGRIGQAILGTALLGSGILLCTAQPIVPVSFLWNFLPPPPLGLQGDQAIFQKTIGAVLVFGGIALLPVLQRQLERAAPRFLGKVSFSLYLTHFPILSTCVAASFTALLGTLPYRPSVAIVAVVGIAASFIITAAFERWIDRPSIMLSRMAGGSHRPVVTSAPAIEAV